MSLWRRERDPRVPEALATKIEVGVLGATGTVGQQLVSLLENHPWFQATWLGASERSAGHRYRELPWRLPGKAPNGVADRKVEALKPAGAPHMVFSALDAAVAGDAERAFAGAGHYVFSNARNHRMDPVVPLVIPEVNPEHVQLLDAQQGQKRWRGAIITNPNCSTIFLALALGALRDFEVKRVMVTTLQALSGADRTGTREAQLGSSETGSVKIICGVFATVGELARSVLVMTGRRKKVFLVVVHGFIALIASMSTWAATPKADVIFVRGRIYQPPRQDGGHLDCSKLPVKLPAGSGLDCASHSYAEALAVKDGKVVAVGDTKSILKWKGSKTVVVDLEGRFVLPGFNDAHLHLASGGFEKLNVDLVGTKSLVEMQQRISDRVKTTSAGEWIRGRGWDHTKWESQVLPTREDLDRVTEGHPAIFTRVDGHICVVNTAALGAADINKDTADPQGGRIDRDERGEPTGILREGARDAVDKIIPRVNAAERRKAIELALGEAVKWGLTSLQDNSGWQDFLVYEDLEREGKLTARITEWLSFDDSLETLNKQRAHHSVNDSMLRTGMLKGFLDGSLGSRTAALLRPYSDDPKNLGLPQYDQTTLNHLTRERLAAGFQIGFHAIGDRAVEMALAAFEDAMQHAKERSSGEGKTDYRLRVEHAQVTTFGQIDRFANLNVIASMQPNHLLTDMNWAMERLGTERAASSYAWRSLLNAGAHLAFGTDYPVEPLTPFRGLYAAVTRKNEAGTKEYFPEETLTIEQAIEAYTSGAAYAEFAEKSKGELVPGQWADLVVLDRDITQIPAEQILGTKVLRTVVGGKTVYAAPRAE